MAGVSPFMVIASANIKVSSPPCPRRVVPTRLALMLKVSAALPPMRISKAEKSKVGLTVYWEIPVTSDQVLGKSIPARVSLLEPEPMRALMLKNPPLRAASVPSKPSVVPAVVNITFRELPKADRSSVSSPAPPSMFSKEVKV